MKAHKRLMQSLQDAARKPTRQSFEDVVQTCRRLQTCGARKTGQAYAKQVALNIQQLTRVEANALRFTGTQVQRWDGEKWVAHRMPGMHRRGGKWVRR